MDIVCHVGENLPDTAHETDGRNMYEQHYREATANISDSPRPQKKGAKKNKEKEKAFKIFLKRQKIFFR